MANKKPPLYVSKKDQEKKGVKPAVKDERLDKLAPLLIDIMTMLLNSAGMMRYRKDFVGRVKEIMDGKEKGSA